ncbi:LCD1 [Candida jiufengensis]|uniref:LCD1 n=1 Tax=Candida jiufengensis TaxID=497108 RepID=UPI002224B14F|nr:LCD1 [Candida jiufengensis]KAI5951590.1 LCD1 [Candida jiufengensis]
MTSSDNDFDDDEYDELLQGFLTGRTQLPINQTQNISKIQNTSITPSTTAPLASQFLDKALNDESQSKLFQADGEIATLKAQLLQLQNAKREEVNQLKQSLDALKRSKDSETTALNDAINKLEDDRKFLRNELITTNALKKRKTTNGFSQPINNHQQNRPKNDRGNDFKTRDFTQATPIRESSFIVKPAQPVQTNIKQQNDTSLLIDQLWNYCIVGSPRKSFDYLSKVCFEFEMETLYGYKIKRRQPLSSSIIDILMNMKDLKLELFIEKITSLIFDIITQASAKKFVVSIPFLISLIYCAISFRPNSVTKKIIIKLIQNFAELAKRYLFLLNPNLEEEVDFEDYHDVPDQVVAIEKYILIISLDLIEKLVSIASIYDAEFIKKVWSSNVIPTNLIKTCLPQNGERFKTVAQVNVIFNIVEMLNYSLTEDTFGFNDSVSDVTMILSLMNIFSLDIPIKEGLKFYGLNRLIGNNFDMRLIDATIPIEHDKLNNYLIVIPQPIYKISKQNPPKKDLNFNDENHILNLKIRVTELLISIIITKQTVEFLYDKEYFKSFIRIISIEQIHISKNPRSQLIHHRVQLIALIVKILNYLTQDLHEASDLVYSETLYELYVVLSRIAFGSDSLSIEAHKLLSKIRSKGYQNPVFNKTCETQARLLNHLTVRDFEDGKLIANIESDYANGFEFPYDSETVELSRDILNRFVNQEEADNLYFNMNYESDDEENSNVMPNNDSDEEMNL